ncbi:MAG: DUF255 domain-containing protein [Planctomycetes bacterium]|nr:DUF255 domain-containing protein [Planctomycetota bacterium]NOG54461.1 DUF255 domain-containing protein [Planctomycetota bacterium]
MTRERSRLRSIFTLPALISALMMIIGLSARPVAAQEDDGEDTYVRLNLAWEQDAAEAGSWVGLAVVMDLDEGWHIWPGLGTPDENPDYIATSIGVTRPTGWSVDPIQWPRTHDFTFFGEELLVYEGRAIAYIPVHVPEGTAAGSYTFSIDLYYQTCDDSVCLAPTTITQAIALQVAAADADEPQKINTETFAGYAPPAAVADESEAPEVVIDTPDRVSLSLVWQRPSLVAGDQIGLAIVMDFEENWHIWPIEGSGDGGMLPSLLTINLPEGWEIEGMQWPDTHTIVAGQEEFSEEHEVYEGRAVAFASVSLPQTAKAGIYEISASVEYQACSDQICEGLATVEARINTMVAGPSAGQAPPPDEATSALFTTFNPTFKPIEASETDSESEAEWLTDIKPHFKGDNLHWWAAFFFGFLAMAWMAVQTWVISQRGGVKILVALIAIAVIGIWLNVTVGLTGKSKIHWVDFTPDVLQTAMDTPDQFVVMEFTADWCLNCKTLEQTVYAHETVVTKMNQPNVTAIKVDLSHQTEDEAAQLIAFGGGGIPLTVVYQPDEDYPTTVLRGPFTRTALLKALGGESGDTSANTTQFNFLSWQFSIGTGAWVWILLLAFIAGFFMNFTPCVLPVIPLKILSLQAHAKHPAKCFGLGVVFGLGIVAAYLVLGVFIAVVALGSRKLQWGEMFSYWWVSMPLGLIIAAMGLGMLGLFTMRLPNFVYMFNPQSDSATGSFFFGVFTAVLSTPCTGPLLGAAVTWATTQSPVMALSTFLMMGVGMAFPYVLLTARPAWIDRLPHAGPGSELIKQVMGLLLFAVAAWFIGLGVISLGTTKEVEAESTAIILAESHSDLQARHLSDGDYPFEDFNASIRS